MTTIDDRMREFELVVDVRKVVAGVGKGTTAATAAEYERIYERLVSRGELPEDARSRPDYYRRRAAIVFVEANHAREALRARDKSPDGSVERSAAVAELCRIKEVFERYPPDPTRTRHASNAPGVRWRDVASEKAPAPSRSKRTSLGALVRRNGWQNALMQHVSERHRNALAVAILTGARPAEIAQGVTIKRVGDSLHCTIRGAKLGEFRGQPTRTLALAIDSTAARHLAALAEGGEIIVSTHPKRFSDAVTQAGRRAYPRMRSNISPYSLRHAVASALKAAAINAEDVAQVLGHRATRSQQTYGRACHGRQRTAIRAVLASAPVRRTARNPSAHVAAGLSGSSATPRPR